MSKQGTAIVRLLFLIVAATFLIAVGGGVFAQNTDIIDRGQEGLVIPSPADGNAQDTPRVSKPQLSGGVPSGPPPFAVPSSSSSDPTGIDFQSSPDAPTITIWQESTQKTGANGDPQKWVNIVGTVNPNPASLSLTYSINGNPAILLRRGPDLRRLAQSGDFNIDLDYTELKQGPNHIVIVADDGQGHTSQAEVTIDYQGGGAKWATPGTTYFYDWSTVNRIDDLARVVDGNWELDKNNGVVRPLILSYDRLISIGDLSWRDYTVTVPITFTAIDPAGYEYPSAGPAVGVILRWQGHIQDGNITAPLDGWQRLGAFALYHWMQQPGDIYSEALRMFRYWGYPSDIITKARKLDFGTTYNFKVSVQSTGVADPPANYRFKVWKASEQEPENWDIEGPGFPGEPANGGILLVAHHVDARFGTVEVKLDSTVPLPKLTVNTTGSGFGNVALFPSRQANTYRFGEDVRLTALPNNGSAFIDWQGGLTGSANPAWLEMFSDRTVAATFSNDAAGAPVSDDFSACELDPRWEFINPKGDSTLVMTGSKLQINVPAGATHDMWLNDRNAPRIMQPVSDEDFVFDVKFDSSMDSKYQLQGILVDRDDANFLRFNFQHVGSTYQIAAYSMLNNEPTLRMSEPISISTPMYLRTERKGNEWTLSYSNDGQFWIQAAQFTYNIEAAAVGVFVGNAVDFSTPPESTPAMVGQIDYFFNAASPIVPQDNVRRLAVSTTGSGSGTVTQTPMKTNYGCNDTVILEAKPDAGSDFTGWGVDLSGAVNPITINMTSDVVATANFDIEVINHTLEVSTEGQGTVAVNPTGSQFPEGTQVSLLATPTTGYRFVRWEGDISGNANPATLYMDGDKSVKAVFSSPYTLEILTEGQGTVTTTPAGPQFLPGTQVSLFASPAEGYRFIRWGGAISGNSNPYFLYIDGDKSVRVIFAPLQTKIFFPTVLATD